MALSTRQFDPVAELQTAFNVLLKNWTLALPTAIASLLSIIFLTTVLAATGLSVLGAGALSAHPAGALTMLGAGGATLAGGLIILILISIVAHATVIAAAEDAWEGRQPDLRAGVAKALAKFGPVLIASLLIGLIAIFCSLLIVVLIGFALLLVLGFGMMYYLPSIIVGPESGTSSLQASWRLATRNFGPSAVAFIGMILAYIVGACVNVIIGHIPIIGWIAAFLVGGFTSAFAALVSVRFYDLLTQRTPSAAMVTPQTLPPL
jgi:hypothetical protein